MKQFVINPRDSESEVAYISGDYNVPAVFTSTEAEGGITKTLKIQATLPGFWGEGSDTVLVDPIIYRSS